MFESKNKITMATFKSLVKKNNNLHIKVLSSFDGMTDCVNSVKDDFTPIKKSKYDTKENLGISGVWLVGGSRDSFSPYFDGAYDGVKVYNCCGCFILAEKIGE